MARRRPARLELLVWALVVALLGVLGATQARCSTGLYPVPACLGGVGRAIFEVRGLGAATPAP